VMRGDDANGDFVVGDDCDVDDCDGDDDINELRASSRPYA